MKTKRIKTALMALAIAAAASAVASCATAEAAESKEYVYECTGKGAKVYHTDPDCKGLSACKATVRKVEAGKTKRRPCKICAD